MEERHYMLFTFLKSRKFQGFTPRTSLEHYSHIVCTTPSPPRTFYWEVGGGDGGELPTKFSKRGLEKALTF